MLLHAVRAVRRAHIVVVFTGLLTLACAGAAQADTTLFLDSDSKRLSVVSDGSADHDVVIERIAGGVKVVDTTEHPTVFGAGCENTNTDATATCSGTVDDVAASFENGDDHVELIGIAGYSVSGGEGDDTLVGSALADTLQGGPGQDTIDGRAGEDLLYGDDGDDVVDGGADGDVLEGGHGADDLHDTGTSGTDAVTYWREITDPAGVEVTLDGEANDGNVNQDAGGTDDVGVGIEHLQGSRFGDELVGSPGPDFLSGAEGDDRLVGLGGADSFNGADGDDRIEARDGDVDADVDCDNSMGSHGTADVAVLDSGDPQPRNCESVQRPDAGDVPPGPGPGPGPLPGPGPGVGQVPGPPVGGGLKVLETDQTRVQVAMPGVVGQKMDPARRAVLQKISGGVDLDVEFQRGCPESKDQEVTRQRPAKGTRIDTYEGSDVPVRLYVCMAERDFLADCDLKDLKNDLKEIPKNVDADLGLAVLGRFTKCKVDYDVKMTKKAEEARIALEAQKAAVEKARKDGEELSKREREAAARKAKAQIRAAIECPTAPEDQDLTMTLTEGAVATRGRFGLKASGPDGWTIPAGPTGKYTSYVDIMVRDKGAPVHAVAATIYVDGEDVGIPASDLEYPNQSAQRVVARQGYARLLLTPQKPGVIRLCAVFRTGDDQALTAATQVRVVGPLKVGDTWTTVSGRKLTVGKNGPVEEVAKGRRASVSANPLEQAWDFIVGLFGGRSKSITAAAAEGTLRTQKLQSIQSRWAAAQVSVDGTLDPDPRPPTLTSGKCNGYQKGGMVLELTCPQLTTNGGTALLGMSTDGKRIVAEGYGNVLSHNGGALVGAGAGNILSHNGGAVVATESLDRPGATLIGTDGASAIGPAVAQLVGQDGASILARDGAGLVGTDGASLVGQDGGSLIGTDGGSIVAAGSLNLVPPGGLD